MSIRIGGSINAINNELAPATPTEGPAADGAPSVMPKAVDALTASGDVGAMIAALLLESGKEARKSAKLLKEAAAAAEEAAQARRIEHMASAATWKLVGGVAAGAGEVVGGIMAGTGALSGNAVDKFSPIAKGGGGVDGAIANYLSSADDREAQKAEHEATQAKRNVEAAGDIDKDAKDLIQRAMSHYGDYIGAKDSASKAALFRA